MLWAQAYQNAIVKHVLMAMQLPDSALSKTVQIHVGRRIIKPLAQNHAASAWLLALALSPSQNCNEPPKISP